MYKIKTFMVLTAIVALVSVTVGAQTQMQRGDRRDDRQIAEILVRIDQRTARFQNIVQQAVNQSRLDNTQKEQRIDRLTTEFQQAVRQLRDRQNRRQATTSDIEMLLEQASRIDSFMQRFQLSAAAESEWKMLRTDLESLAGAYNVAWNWNNNDRRGSNAAERLSGTFRLNTAQSDNARAAVERAVLDLPYSDRQRVTEALLRRVDAPEMLAIDRQGRAITLASSRAPQMTFEADGQEHVEQSANSNRTMRVMASLNGDQLSINTSGDRASDFSVMFDPINNGRQLRVTRRLSSERLSQPVVVQSTYDQVSPTARWDVYNGAPAYNDRAGNDRGNNDRNYDRGGNDREFIVPDGVVLQTRLNDNLYSNQSHAGDPFTLTVQSPPQYRGATIEGYVADVNRSGRLTGRSELTLNLASIRLPNGRTYRFEGMIEGVRAPNGETLRIDREGAVASDDSQTSRTVTRTAIGSAVGAIIGAVAGGGKGAAIGAVVGGGAGAGSVYVQGRNNLELNSGTELTIRSSAPTRRG